MRRVEVVRTFRARLRGLLGRNALSPGEGLLLRPCRAIHTIGMRFAIDAVFLDREFRVTRVCRDVRPGRLFVSGGPRAAAVLEMAAGHAPAGLEPGAAVTFA